MQLSQFYRYGTEVENNTWTGMSGASQRSSAEVGIELRNLQLKVLVFHSNKNTFSVQSLSVNAQINCFPLKFPVRFFA